MESPADIKSDKQLGHLEPKKPSKWSKAVMDPEKYKKYRELANIRCQRYEQRKKEERKNRKAMKEAVFKLFLKGELNPDFPAKPIIVFIE
jgi:hypothetical protein